ncbi:hypothetical protein HGRIS_011311 [Hohenbuehelia grisea]|uniref:Phosphodiesterase n=1 Tax=Hohenbuehelia grisea TaxID=104357 RepID=A0ABR3JVI1_9AGAR
MLLFCRTRFAELLSDMYEQTLNAVREQDIEFTPAELPKKTRHRLIKSLNSWNFEPHKLPDEERLSCTMILFEALYRIEGMEETVGISLKQIAAFVHHLRRIYRLENSYHNFEHALDVLQAIYCYLKSAGMVPPVSILFSDDRTWRPDKAWDSGPIVTSLQLVDLFVIYVAGIGHDVGHPGFTNMFMEKAQSPLSVVFDGKSALEHMHCQLLLRVMREHGFGALLSNPVHGLRARKLLWSTVLATDMSVHTKFMDDLKYHVAGGYSSIWDRQVLACQALIKCADISNPSRPYPVAKHWAMALASEWMSQADLEKYYDIKQTIPSVHGPLQEANSQVFFSSVFALPLLELTAQAIPEMTEYAQACSRNLCIWQDRAKKLNSNVSAQSEIPLLAAYPPHSPKAPADFQNAFPLTLPMRSFPASYTSQSVDPTPIWTKFLRPPSGPPTGSSSSSSSGSSASKRGRALAQALEETTPSVPSSPSESCHSFILSPHSDLSSSNLRPPSSCGSSAPLRHCLGGSDAIICAASKAARRKKGLFENRNSWSPPIAR